MMKKKTIIGICFCVILILFGIKKLNDYENAQTRKDYIALFESYYANNIEENNEKIVAYINNIPIYDKDIRLFFGISILETKHYAEDEEACIENAIANVILDAFYIDLATKHYGVKDIEIEDGVQEVKEHLKIQSKNKSPIVSATSEIRLLHFDDYRLWFAGRYCFRRISDSILMNHESVPKEEMGTVIMDKIVEKSEEYEIEFNKNQNNGFEKKRLLEQLGEYKFTYQ